METHTLQDESGNLGGNDESNCLIAIKNAKYDIKPTYSIDLQTVSDLCSIPPMNAQWCIMPYTAAYEPFSASRLLAFWWLFLVVSAK